MFLLQAKRNIFHCLYNIKIIQISLQFFLNNEIIYKIKHAKNDKKKNLKVIFNYEFLIIESITEI